MTRKQPILDELHAIRERLLAESGGTLAGLVARLQAEQAASGRTIRKAPRTNRCAGAARSGESAAGQFKKDEVLDPYAERARQAKQKKEAPEPAPDIDDYPEFA